MTKTGICLCGSVAFSVEIENETFTACHCSMCRKWGGGVAFSVDVKNGLKFTGAEFVTTYDSSHWAQRGFCKRCGTHLFYKLKNSTYSNVPLGLLNDSGHFKFETQIFIDNKPSSYDFANKTNTMTEAQVMEQIGQSPK